MRVTGFALALAGCGLAACGLAGCGGDHRARLAAGRVADCLTAKGFLVESSAAVVQGTSPGGVSFTMTVYATPAAAATSYRARRRTAATTLLGDAIVDDSGNPPATAGAAPGKLSSPALAAIGACLVPA